MQEDFESNAKVAIERERQKTRRYLLFLIFFSILVISGMLILFRDSESGGKRTFDVDLSKGQFKMSMDKPIVDQAETKSVAYKGGTEGPIQFTTGDVDLSLIEQLEEENVSFTPNQLVGENFVNKEAGFLLTVKNPSYWNVNYNSAGMYNPVTPLNTLYTSDGSHLNVNIEAVASNIDLQAFVNTSLQNMIMMGFLSQMPEVSYDYASNTAFLSYVNVQTGGETYQKVIFRNGYAYIASANYNPYITEPERIDDLINMVATFTLIGR